MSADFVLSESWSLYGRLCKQSPTFDYIDEETGKGTPENLLMKVREKCLHLKAKNKFIEKTMPDAEKEALYLLGEAYRFSDQLYCGQAFPTRGACCYVHIVKTLPCNKWRNACAALDEDIKKRLGDKQDQNMEPKEILRLLRQAGQSKETVDWLATVLEDACSLCKNTGQPLKQDADQDLCDVVYVARKYAERHAVEDKRMFRPVQLAAILVNVHAAWFT